ncbi:hypothetical protein AABB24_035113 [Solanum stoloniferum]|uniref:Protein yippee-like n=1 Tax=Solanum stoloniferum TaxID=62892 RepID=A0ABD2R729_9SOLN
MWLVTVSYNMLSTCKSVCYVLLLYWHCSVNVTLGEKEERMMLTGMHTVVDIFCVGCGSIVGWKYEAAQEKDQKYKEGRSLRGLRSWVQMEATIQYFNMLSSEEVIPMNLD